MRLFLSLIVLFAARSVMAQDLKGDLAKLQGKWEARLGDERRLLTWEVKGDKVTAKTKTDKGEFVVTKFKMKLDEKAEPKAMDSSETVVEFETLGKSEADDAPAIYELKGDDWKVCLGLPKGSRPKKFEKGDDATLVSFKRVKDEPSPKQ